MILKDALQVLLDEYFSDWVYDIREREGKGWDGPRVIAYGEACSAIENYMKQ